MKLSILLTLVTSCATAAALWLDHGQIETHLQQQVLTPSQHTAPNNTYTDMDTACRVIHKLIELESVVSVNTLNHDSYAMSFPEYALDPLHSHNPILLSIDMSTDWKNILLQDGEGASITYTVQDSRDYQWPGSVDWSMYGMPRMNLHGTFQELVINGTDMMTMDTEDRKHLSRVRYVSEEEMQTIERAFLHKHPESKLWMPRQGHEVHASRWLEFAVTWSEPQRFVGGFGGWAFVGNALCPQDSCNDSTCLMV
jgi:hypothetical protein